MTARIVLHLPQRMINGFQNNRPPLLYGRIQTCLASHGTQAEIVEDTILPADDGNLHIVENGRLNAPNVLNAATAYLEGFFHVDPIGIQAASGIGALTYDPASIDPIAAQAYLTTLQRRFVAPRRSRYQQLREHTDLPEDAIAVFLQGPAPQKLGQAYCSQAEMLQTVCAAANGRPVLVKPHPLKPELGHAIIASARAMGFAPIETAANIHDILAACAVTVSINSAACIEGFLHGKPAVLFGKSDYHHFTETAKTPADFPYCLHNALTNRLDHARALYWYFGQHCLDIKAESFDERLLSIVAEAGFSPKRFGLTFP